MPPSRGKNRFAEMAKTGRNQACPCGSGKKIQEVLPPEG
ncbi:MAG: SEC-C domain-containing protein [Deltaproteobacteria bacterium]|nr:SEC-C domain-containing protein [Deltaproteobacteria bacterium]